MPQATTAQPSTATVTMRSTSTAGCQFTVPSLTNVGAPRASGDQEAPAVALLAVLVLAAAPATRAADAGGGDDGPPVALVGVAEHAPHGQGVARGAEQFVQCHGPSPPSWGAEPPSPSAGAGWWPRRR